jgi:hypothetical protein
MKRVKAVDYVFAVYHSLVVAVYRPTQWFRCKDDMSRRPRQDEPLAPEMVNRLYFVDDNFENGLDWDTNERFYYGKSIAELKLNHRAQNPITYLSP